MTINTQDSQYLKIALNELSVNLSEVEITAKKRKVFELRRLQDIEGTSIYAGKKTEVHRLRHHELAGRGDLGELAVEPDFGGVVVLHQHPLPDVELPPLDQQRVLDVLLHHELGGSAHAVVRDVVDVVEAPDAAASGHD